MKKLILLIILSSLCVNAFAQKKNDLTKKNLKGKVKSLKITKYKAIDKSGEIIKGKKKKKSDNYLFNERGNVVEEGHYNYNGSLRFKYIYKYDNKGNKIEHKVYIQRINYVDKLINKYDERGNVIEESRYKSDGSLSSKSIYKYDDKGNKIEDNKYNSDGSLIFNSIYKYDNKGNKIEDNRKYKSDGDLLDYKIIYKYDERGNVIEYNEYKPDSSYKIIYKYHKYDKYGNWIQKIYFYNDDVQKTIVEREIEYYD